MKCFTPALATLAVVLLIPASAEAEFGLNSLSLAVGDADGTPSMQAGSHPFAMTSRVTVNAEGGLPSEDTVKDLVVELPSGLAIDAGATPRCSAVDFATVKPSTLTACPDSTVVGIGSLDHPTLAGTGALFNLEPPPGVAVKLGFRILSIAGILELGAQSAGEHKLVSLSPSLPQIEPFYGAILTFWGVPADPAHDPLRGNCLTGGGGSFGDCPAAVPEVPFLTLPTSCRGPLRAVFKATSWLGFEDEGVAETHDGADPPAPLGTSGCARLAFHPSVTAEPTSRAARSPSGLDFSLEAEDEGLTSATGLAASQVKEAEITLPGGMTVNPSVGEGLAACTESQLGAETAASAPGEGCPRASKIGSAELQSPVLDKALRGSLFVAEPYENPFNSLLALYIVLKGPERGILLTQAAEVELDPHTGQVTARTGEMPQLPFPFSSFRLRLREGTRSPLATPPGCGAHQVKALLTPWSGTPPVTAASAFQVISGPGNGPCPTGGLPPFRPGIEAGARNNAAGRYSPFDVRLSRTDADQEITRFSVKLPPGIAGKLAGIPYCPEAAIAFAKARSGPRGGHAELRLPSCPPASGIGRTMVGLGTGPALAYAPGRLYLAGPHNGSPLSVVAITAGVIGPFDIGTVVVREAFRIDPETAEVFIDATGSDPIPHIVKGVPVHLRDIRAYVERPGFARNPTSCERTSTAATLLGAGLDFGSGADDRPLTVSAPFQAAGCAALGFGPRLSLALRGGTRRGDHPALSATLRMRGEGEASLKRAQVTLPPSEFLENAHIKAICTRAQFRQDQCPPASAYGRARAVTPLLSEPLAGPVYLRSSEHQLPGLVAALSGGGIEIDLSGRIDSVRGGIRATFEALPDAPVTSFTLNMRGGAKGLIVNSTNLCKGTHRARVSLAAHNGKSVRLSPALGAKCRARGGAPKRAGRGAAR